MGRLKRVVMSGTEGAERAIALVRLAFLPAAIIGHEARGPVVEGVDPFVPWLALATVYALGALAISRDDRFEVPVPVLVAIDLSFLAILTYHSGGAASHLRYAFLAIPLGAAFYMRPRVTALWTLAALGAWGLTVALHPATYGSDGAARAGAHLVYVAWLGGASVMFSAMLARRSDRIGELAEARGRLVAELIGAEEEERRRVATLLHDGPVQQLMLARAWLGRAAASGVEDVKAAEQAVADAIGQLRGTMQDLHPYVLDFAGLAPALECAGERAMPDGVRCDVAVEGGATGFRDQILYSVARELLVNAAKHADGDLVTVQIGRRGDMLELRVRDDGRGFEQGRRLESLREGHIGLASCAQRVEALGGRFEVRSEPGVGTDVRATMPIPATALLGETAPRETPRRRRHPVQGRTFAPGGAQGLRARGAD